MNPDELEKPILDLRPAADFEGCHRRGAVNIPLETLAVRIHELPSPDVALLIFDADLDRALAAQRMLSERGRTGVEVRHGTLWLMAGVCEVGASAGCLWSPHELLVRGVEAARLAWGDLAGRRALDIGCGTGRDAVFMAMSGLAVEAWDVLPDALERCLSLAGRHGAAVTTACRDVERDPTIPADSYDLVTCFNFLHRPLMGAIAAAVRPGGFVVYETFAEEQRRLFGKPKSDAHLLKSGELAGYFQEFEIVYCSERLASPRRFVASLIVRRR